MIMYEIETEGGMMHQDRQNNDTLDVRVQVVDSDDVVNFILRQWDAACTNCS